MASQRLGIFGGTFDPPHLGHLVSALNVRHELGLDEVLLVVNNLPWQKAGTRPISPPADRLAMVQAAVAGVEGLTASSIEIDAGGASYTADTLAVLLAEDPGRELFVILGADAAAGLLTWERAEDVRRHSTIVVVERPGVDSGPMPEGWSRLAVSVPSVDFSSTDLRQRVRDGRPIDFLVTHEVADWIERHGLYRNAG